MSMSEERLPLLRAPLRGLIGQNVDCSYRSFLPELALVSDFNLWQKIGSNCMYLFSEILSSYWSLILANAYKPLDICVIFEMIHLVSKPWYCQFYNIFND